MKTLLHLSFLFILFFLLVPTIIAQTGKVSGTITDARTGDPLISANVVIEGTTIGATTNLEGYFVILNVPPGVYRVRASIIGYAPHTATDVRVLPPAR